ncbi:FtsK/SpoIIIE family DNA translocase [Desulfotomaculum copahuensis]|uniref:Cell division protein FtsK n=1 Tax=Desulfotomaculum copahuensis TaxID=1838280 RepID=A0A1B7LJX4_9FIRM|nr:DNA translocase FtsK [Desulfotomaculum copahuensis]OAT86772.1 cell division protein FtsK [Desulfotomaculum copahuensis]
MTRRSKPARKELKYELCGLALICLALLGLASLFTPAVGATGHFLARGLSITAGKGRYLLPVLLIPLGVKVMREGSRTRITPRTGGIALILIAFLTALHLSVPPAGSFPAAMHGDGGGLAGAAACWLFRIFFGQIGSYIVLGAVTLTGILLLTGKSLVQLGKMVAALPAGLARRIRQRLENLLSQTTEENKNGRKVVSLPVERPIPPNLAAGGEPSGTEPETIPGPETGKRRNSARCAREPREPQAQIAAEAATLPCALADGRAYRLPPTSLLTRPQPRDGSSLSKEIEEKIHVLEETLTNFGIKARVAQVAVGPAITRYEIQPPAGIKVSRIVGLADDIALAMAAPDVRIEAPIPGKAAVGIEVPNREIATVQLRELLEYREFTGAASRLTVALGRDIAGTPVLADLGRMPHLLVAGATGSGKSVCINTLIASILFKATPDEVKLLMIDPKMVELTTYNGIPHLVAPVVTDAKKAAGTLRWAVKEMERRYELFAGAGVREISRYNSQVEKTATAAGADPDREGEIPRRLPFVVIIIDELADLMMVAPADVEDSICRLAQMARAAGMHLVVATQRPSVDVITGLIKANIPSRISFAVSSQTDSRTILDMAGAEKLLGKGDMLFYPVGAPKPLRVQGAFLSDSEVESLTGFLRQQAKPVFDEQAVQAQPVEDDSAGPEDDDELLPQAVRILIENGHASISMLQRRLHIGYARAARLIDMMERRGIVGGFEGSKPRAILMTMEQYRQVFKQERTG